MSRRSKRARGTRVSGKDGLRMFIHPPPPTPPRHALRAWGEGSSSLLAEILNSKPPSHRSNRRESLVRAVAKRRAGGALAGAEEHSFGFQRGELQGRKFRA